MGAGGLLITHVMRRRIVNDHRPLYPYSAGTEHVGISLTSQNLLAPCAKRREVVWLQSHEGRAASC